MNAQKLTTSIRLDADLIARLDRLADAMSERAGGAPVNRSSAARVALERGLVDLESEFKLARAKRRT